MKFTFVPLLALMLFLVFCKDDGSQMTPPEDNPPGSPSLTSSFENDALMPLESGKNNGNISPPLTIKNVPAGTVEMALTMRDLDYNDSWHWAIWNIPASKTSIAKGESWDGLPVTIGQNDYGTGYVGPFPPSEHRYQITVFFLNGNINLLPGQYKNLPGAISDKLISKVSITGRYK